MSKLRPMRDREEDQAAALSRCRLAPGGGHRKFIQDMKHLASDPLFAVITGNQGSYLKMLAWRYRKQLNAMGKGHLVPATKPDSLVDG